MTTLVLLGSIYFFIVYTLFIVSSNIVFQVYFQLLSCKTTQCSRSRGKSGGERPKI